MTKIFIKISLIIFGNLFAFLSVWYILSALFWFDRVVYTYLMLLSIVSLVILLRLQVKSYKQNLENIITKSGENNGK